MQWSSLPWRPDDRTLRQFGGLCLVFGIVAAGSSWREGRQTLAAVVAATAALGAAVGWMRPQWLRPIFVGWMVLAFPIGWLVLHGCLAAVYFGAFTPLGLVFRIAGRDPLQLRRRPDGASYWQPKPRLASDRYYKTF